MIKLEPYQTLESIRAAFGITTGLHLLRTLDKVIVTSSLDDDLIHVQIGMVTHDGFVVNPDLAKAADTVYNKLKGYFDSNKHDGLNDIILEITDELQDDTSAYCLCLDHVDDMLDNIAIETKDFNELMQGIERIIQ